MAQLEYLTCSPARWLVRPRLAVPRAAPDQPGPAQRNQLSGREPKATTGYQSGLLEMNLMNRRALGAGFRNRVNADARRARTAPRQMSSGPRPHAGRVRAAATILRAHGSALNLAGAIVRITIEDRSQTGAAAQYRQVARANPERAADTAAHRHVLETGQLTAPSPRCSPGCRRAVARPSGDDARAAARRIQGS
jgi:hypothetical protein